MVAKQSFFVSLAKETITEVSIPDTTEYEIIATEEEIDEIKALLRDNEHHNISFAASNLPVKPFSEQEVDRKRQHEHDNLLRIYHLLYKYGTMETKQKLNEIGLGQ